MSVPEYTVKVFTDGDTLPAEAEELFDDELAYSREEDKLEEIEKYGVWTFTHVSAVTDDGHVLGGIHMDIGPIHFGPLKEENHAILEGVFVRPEYRQNGVGTALMGKASEAAKEKKCFHIRGAVDWDNPAAIALYRKTGFAVVDVNDEGEEGSYFIVKPL